MPARLAMPEGQGQTRAKPGRARKRRMKTLVRAMIGLGIMFGCADGALAQTWPNRPIRMIVPYTPGGYTDLMARLVGNKISEALGQTMVFENKPGANAIIG